MDNYVIISPVKNEEENIEKTISSVVTQTLLPLEWVIVNDGSTDRTREIVEKYMKMYKWIKLVNKGDCGYRPGEGIVEAFYMGYKQIRNNDFNFIVKLDGDISFGPKYFDNILKKFSLNPRLGIASGQTYYVENEKIIWEDAPIDHVRGASKIYRRKCFNDINGFVKSLGWDTIDEVTARMKGWETRSYPEYKIFHHRFIGSTAGIFNGNMRHGYTAYITGQPFLYFFLRCIYRIFFRPYIFGGVALFCGYIKPFIMRKPRVVDKKFQNYYVKEQLGKLLNRGFWSLYIGKMNNIFTTRQRNSIYSFFWLIGAIISFLLYFSGIVRFFVYVRKNILRQHRNIVLTYHRINVNRSNSDISVSNKLFERQIEYLKRNFKVISLNEMLNNLKVNKVMQNDNVAITFDDGYKDNFLNAFSVLSKRNLPATIFLVAEQIGKPDMLTVKEIKTMQDNGFTFGSHTLTHRVLTEIDKKDVKKEIFDSKQQLEKCLNKKVGFFAYPKGKKRDYNIYIKNLVQQADYKAAFTTENGSVDDKSDIYEVRRLGIRSCPMFVFKTRVSGIFESKPLLFLRKFLRLT